MFHIHIKQYPNSRHCYSQCVRCKTYHIESNTLKKQKYYYEIQIRFHKCMQISHATCGITLSTGKPNPLISFIACYPTLIMNISNEIKDHLIYCLIDV